MRCSASSDESSRCRSLGLGGITRIVIMDPASDNDLAKIRRRVESHPTDLQARFELGVALCSRHDYVAAIPELQWAMSSPPVRFRAMALLADAFDSRGMTVLAAWMREHLGDEGDSGSAPRPLPTQPFTPHDSSGASKIPDEDEHAPLTMRFAGEPQVALDFRAPRLSLVGRPLRPFTMKATVLLLAMLG